MMGRKWMGLFLILCFLFFPLASGQAQEKKGARKGGEKGFGIESGLGFKASRAPINITSDTVEADQKKNAVTFKGDVVVKQEDITLYASTVVATYDPNTKKMKEIMAMGNVKIVQLDRRATSQKATFNQDQNKVILEGDAVVREGENVIRGERVVFYVDEERAIVEGSKGGRVTTTITPPPKEEGEGKKPKADTKK